MKKELFSKFIKLISTFVCAMLVIGFFSACSFGNTENTYSITGYVYDEHGAVEGVELKSDLGSVYTDATGKYTLSGIKESVIVEPVCEGYQFAKASKLITSAKDDANFTASKEYTVSGYVKNNTSLVSGAYVTINSLSGEFVTITDEQGYFEGKNVAGDTVVSCTMDGVEFFTQTASIDNHIVDLNLTSTFTLRLEFDTTEINYQAIDLVIGGKSYKLTSATTTFGEIYSGTVVELKSDIYMFSKPQFYISSLNQIENIQVSKVYGISGTVSSGDTILEGAKILVDGAVMTTTDQNGYYSLTGLVSIHNVGVQFDSLSFNSQKVDSSVATANFNGTKSVTLNFNFDNKVSNSNLSFENLPYETLSDNSFRFNSVCLGDEIEFSSKEYHFETDSIFVGKQDLYSINAYALYNLAVGFGSLDIDLANVQIMLDGNVVEQSELIGLFGTHSVTAQYSNYVFETKQSSFKNSNIVLLYQIPYDVELYVTSGDIVLVGANVNFNNENYYANADGIISITQLIGQNQIIVECENYNSQFVNVSSEDSFDGKVNLPVNLTYDIRGTVKTGNEPVANANVKAVLFDDEFDVETNSVGEYFFVGLYGNIEIVVTKDYFSFDSAEVSFGKVQDFAGIYRIFGYLTTTDESGNEIPFENIKVVLLTQQGQMPFYITESDGYYEFNNLSGKYALTTVNVHDGMPSGLKPDTYQIVAGGEYNFNNKGYSISGTITSGGIPVEGVYVQAGSTGTFTDAKGEYKFELLTGECEIIPQKEGYDFGSKVIVSDERNDVDFKATYTVSGTISSGSMSISDVQILVKGEVVSLSDSNGNFNVTGLAGNETIKFQKTGYYFENNVSVNSATKINIECLVAASLYVKTGDIHVSDFTCFAAGKVYNATGNCVEIYVTYGETVSFEKEGYQIENVIVTLPNSYVVFATYSIFGKVNSGDVSISNVAIKTGENIVYSDTNGNFSISGLAGETIIEFSKTGYNIPSIKANGYDSDFEVNATYTVSGKVVVGTNPLSNVKVKYNGISVETDSTGSFKFDSVSGKFTLAFEKEGYTFSEVSDMFGQTEITVNAFYSISGRVVSGDVAVSGASISLSIANSSKKLYATSDENGYFTISGISGVSSIIVSKDDYTSVTKSDFDDIITNLEINLAYTYSITFEGTGKTNITIHVGNQTFTASNNVKIKDLYGLTEIWFERANTVFTPAKITVREPGNMTINTTVSYNITGYVKSKVGNFPIVGVKVVVGSSSVLTNQNGFYSFSGVAGNIQIANEYLGSYTTTISKDGEYNILVESSEFGYLLYANADKNIRTSTSAQIVGTGSVVGDAGITKTTQYVHAIYKRDNQGNVVRQNLNYGDAVFGIDPKVSMIAVYMSSENKWRYQQVEDGNVTSKTAANHTVSGLKEISVQGFADIYGNAPNNYLPYNITQSNVTISSVTQNSNENYVVSINVPTSQPGYAKQVVALSGVTFDGFQSINMICEINKNGWFVTIKTDERYKIKQGVSVSITSSINYNFLTQSDNLKIDAIDISSDSALLNSLKQSNQSAITYNLERITRNYNIIENLIYGTNKGEADKWKNLFLKI